MSTITAQNRNIRTYVAHCILLQKYDYSFCFNKVNQKNCSLSLSTIIFTSTNTPFLRSIWSLF